MADTADWVFESVLQFMKSPLWRAPVHGFIEEHCSKFDPQEKENKIEYTLLHREFCELVDGLLSGFLSELGVSGEDFIEACKSGRSLELSEMVTEYIMSMDDFQSFRAMMERKNHEMDLEAMHEYARLVQAANDAASADDLDDEERFLLEMAIKASLCQNDVIEKEAMVEDAELLQALAMSMAIEQERLMREQQQADAAMQRQLQDETATKLKLLQEDTLRQRMENVERHAKLAQDATSQPMIAPPPPSATAGSSSHSVTSDDKKPSVTARALAPVGHGRSGNAAPFGFKPLAALSSTQQPTQQQPPQPTFAELNAKSSTAATSPMKKSDQPSEEEVRQRAEYMKAQREALLKLKRENRDKELTEFTAQQTGGAPTALDSDAAKREAANEARIALARRFKEDIIGEARKAGASQATQE